MKKEKRRNLIASIITYIIMSVISITCFVLMDIRNGIIENISGINISNIIPSILDTIIIIAIVEVYLTFIKIAENYFKKT